MLNIFIPVKLSDGYLNLFIQKLCNIWTEVNIVDNIIDADVIFFVIPNFKNCSKINLQQSDYKKPIIVFDFTEYGVSRLRNPNYLDDIIYKSFIGFNTKTIIKEIEASTEFSDINNFLKINLKNIKLYFMRELGKNIFYSKILPFKVQPIDYILQDNIWDSDSCVQETQFTARNLDLTFIWGKTNSDRMSLHGALMYELSKSNLYHHTLTSIEQYNEYISRKKENNNGILLINKNGFANERIDLKPILLNSRLCIDMYGNGMKCFRNPESAIYSASIKQDYSRVKFAYDWIDMNNCFMLPNENNSNKLNVDKSVDIIMQLITNNNRNKIYNIYVNSFNLAKKYIISNYITDFIIPKIKEVL